MHVVTYTVVSADGTEESRITKRRKHTKRLEFCNGKEAKLEEKTEFLTGDVDGFKHTQIDSQVPSHFDNEVRYVDRNSSIIVYFS